MNIISQSEKLCPSEFLNRNFQKEMDKILEKFDLENPPSILLHSCCAPCSSHVISYLSDFFNITVFYYNPNISELDEYNRRAKEQKRFIAEYMAKNPVKFMEGDHNPKEYFELIRGLEKAPEGGERCVKCYRMRLAETARIASEKGFDYFATTLSISPMKSSALINAIGSEVGGIYNAKYLLSDFKKKNGYKHSVELSKEYDLYRQDYCGCIFTKENSHD